MSMSSLIECWSKTLYATRSAAEDAIALIKLDGKRSRRFPVQSYKCGTCQGWHLTSRKSRRPPLPIIKPTTIELHTRRIHSAQVRGNVLIRNLISLKNQKALRYKSSADYEVDPVSQSDISSTVEQ